MLHHRPLALLLLALALALAPACARRNPTSPAAAAQPNLPPELAAQMKAMQGQLDAARARLRRGQKVTDPNAVCGLYFVGALTGDQELFQLLKRSGADVNTSNTATGESALQLAVLADSEAGVKALLDQGADPNRRDNRGKTILFNAVGSVKPSTIALLLERGANPNVHEPVFGSTPLLGAAIDDDVATARVFLQHGADPDFPMQTTGATPLHLAAMNGRLELAELLLKHGADPNAKTKAGTTPLKAATTNRQAAIIELLKKHGAK